MDIFIIFRVDDKVSLESFELQQVWLLGMPVEGPSTSRITTVLDSGYLHLLFRFSTGLVH
ncbi:hypothetical protein ACXZ1K_13235 [Pedobacter sp. PWIIR3]